MTKIRFNIEIGWQRFFREPLIFLVEWLSQILLPFEEF